MANKARADDGLRIAAQPLPNMRVQLTPGFVLHERPYRDTSALLELFTRDYGRLGVVARGVRSQKSRLRGELQPFCPLSLSWQARGELGTLTGAERQRGGGLLSGEALFSAYYLNELLLRLLARHDPHPGLYRDYWQALEGLKREPGVEPVLRRFEKRLLEALGYALVLDHEVETGGAIRPGLDYDYHLESGPMPVREGHTGGFVFSGASLLAMAQERFDSEAVMRDAKRLMRAALKVYLGDKPLRTRRLFAQLKSRSAEGD